MGAILSVLGIVAQLAAYHELTIAVVQALSAAGLDRDPCCSASSSFANICDAKSGSEVWSRSSRSG